LEGVPVTAKVWAWFLVLVVVVFAVAAMAVIGGQPAPGATNAPTDAPGAPASVIAFASPTLAATPTSRCSAMGSPLPAVPATSAQIKGAEPFARISVPAMPSPDRALGAPEQGELNIVLGRLKAYLTTAISTLRTDLPANPHLKAQIEAKIEMLQEPGLYDEIVSHCYYFADSVRSVDGRTIPLVVVFPKPEMRGDAWYSLEIVKQAIPVDEDFMAMPLPRSSIVIFYGFGVGSNSAIELEDRADYIARWKPPMLPYDPILVHEVGHSFIVHEGLNQFFELYTYNMLLVHSASADSWVYFKVPTTSGASPQKTAATLVAIYRLIGLEGMEKAYRAIFVIGDPYGKPLAATVKKVFIDQAPAGVRSKVAALVANLTY
jgi:hypothetical protein